MEGGLARWCRRAGRVEGTGARGLESREGSARRRGRPAMAWMSGLALALVAGVLAASPASAQTSDVTLDFQFPPDFEGTNVPANVDDTKEEEILFQQDFITTESTTLGSREESPAVEESGQPVTTAANAVSFGIDATVTKDLQLFVFPFSYRITPDVKLGLAVPAVHRKGDDGEVYGLGDVSASLGFRWGSPLKVLGITTAFLKAPTGNPGEEDSGEFLPLGTGSWDVALYQTFIKRFGFWRGELTAGYRWNTSADFHADVDFDGTNETIELENGDVVNVILGADREITAVPGLIGSLKVDVRRIQEADLAINDTTQPTPGSKTIVDVLPGIKYFIAPGMPLHLGLRLPLNNTGDRNPAIDFGILRTF
jgi:hypothetical protein